MNVLVWAYSSKSFTPDNGSLSGHLHILLLEVKSSKIKKDKMGCGVQFTQDMTEMTERKHRENERKKSEHYSRRTCS